MKPQPIYTSENVRPAYHLRYTWSGWPSSNRFPDPPSDETWRELDEAWETDGIRRLEGKWTDESIQLTFSVKPTVAPVFFVARVKGRLQHALRTSGQPTKFSRKVAFRTIGDNHRTEVESYIEQQVDKEGFVDPDFQHFLKQFTVVSSHVDLSQPTETNSGRYWYNLHLVLVIDGRWRIVDEASLETIRDRSFKIGEKKGHLISRLSVMPDHVHISLRGDLESSPEETALAYLSNLAYAFGQNAIWQHGYYVGTFSEYDMDAVRDHKQPQREVPLPARPAGNEV